MLKTSTLLRVTVKGMLYSTPLSRYLTQYPMESNDPCARYCYSVWLRHLCMLYQSGVDTNITTLAELGPGDSVGVGIAALLSGAEQYLAFDAYAQMNVESNLALLDQIAALFAAREPIPAETEFPNLKPYLESYEFPFHILPEARVKTALAPERLNHIRNSILRADNSGMIRFYPDFADVDAIEHGSLDLVLSQAVMEHIEHPDNIYEILHDWLRTGGAMSHQIDLKCHDTSDCWNGHWTYSDFVWRMILRGRNRPYPLNRWPLTWHLDAVRQTGFEVTREKRVIGQSSLQRRQLNKQFMGMTAEDLTTSGLFMIAKKQAAEHLV